MSLHNYYWYFKSALTPKFCDEVIAFATSKNLSTCSIVLNHSIFILIRIQLSVRHFFAILTFHDHFALETHAYFMIILHWKILQMVGIEENW